MRSCWVYSRSADSHVGYGGRGWWGVEPFVWFIRAKFYLVHNIIGSCHQDRYIICLCSVSAKLLVYLYFIVFQFCRSLCFKVWFKLLLKICDRAH